MRIPTSGALVGCLLSAFMACVGGEDRGGAGTGGGLRFADSLVAAAVENGTVPGAVLLIARDGQVLLEKAHGSAQLMGLSPELSSREEREEPYPNAPELLARPRPMTVGTAFDLASVTKVMATTMAILLLVDRGAVTLDAPVQAYLPEFRGPGKDSVTVRHLLTHSGGLAQWQPIYYQARNGGEALDAVGAMPLQWGVGEGRRYSDLGFMLLGYLTEREAGIPLDRFLNQELFEPLGLDRTGYRRAGCERSGVGFPCPNGPFAATSHGNPYEYRMVHDTAFGYRFPGDPMAWGNWRRHTLVGEVNDGNAFHAHGGVAGHAGLFSTARELQILLDLLLNGGELGGRRFFRKETLDAFLEPTRFGHGLGWQLPSWAPEGSFSHTGFTGTFVLGVPSEGLALVLLTNRQNLGVGADTGYPEVSGLQRQVAEAVLGMGPAG